MWVCITNIWLEKYVGMHLTNIWLVCFKKYYVWMHLG